MVKNFILIILSFLPLSVSAQDTGFAVYVDSAQSMASARFLRSRRMASRRVVLNTSTVTSRKGMLSAQYDADDVYMLDGMVHCLRMAMDIWEERIGFDRQVPFYVRFSDVLGDDLEMKTVVGYSRSWHSPSSISQPNSLYNQTGTVDLRPDTIYVNANVDWNYTWDYDISYGGGTNLTSAFLRHIGHILGFGTSVTQIGGQLNYAIKLTPSVFDCLVSDLQGSLLSSFGRRANTQNLTSFLKRSLHLHLPTGDCPLYSSSSAYVPYRSAMYFSLPDDNLMNYPYGDRSAALNINKETLDAMQAIGWERTRPHNKEVKGTSLNAFGYGSYYLPHTFHLEDSTGATVPAVTWQCQLYRQSLAQYTTIATGYGSTFTPVFPSGSNEAVDDDGCLPARIVCEVAEGDSVVRYTLPLFLEMRPVLQNFEILNVNVPAGSNYFSFDIRLTHSGTESGEITVCNEYGLSTQHSISGDGTTVVHVDHAFRYGMTYFDLTLNNSFGSNVKLLYYDDVVPPVLATADQPGGASGIHAVQNGVVVTDTMVVRDGDETVFTAVDDSGMLMQELPAGTRTHWALLIDKGDGTAWVKELGADTPSCSFTMTDTFLPRIEAQFQRNIFQPFITYTDPLTRDAYQRAKLRLDIYSHESGLTTHDFPLRLSVLPSVPTVKIVSYYEDVFVDGDYVDVNPIVEVEVDVRNFTGGLVLTSPGSWQGASGGDFGAETPMPHRVTVDWGSEGCGYSCGVENAYGFVFSQFVFPDKTLDVSGCQSDDDLSVKCSGRRLYISAHSMLDNITVIDAAGRICEQASGLRSFTSGQMPPGVYIVKAKRQVMDKIIKVIVK